MEFTFLDHLAKEILNWEKPEAPVIVLPNKRARVFLIESLRKQLKNRIFLPEIISIDDFIKRLSGLRIIDPIELVFEFYSVYEELTPESERQTFEEFAGWAKILLQDFNEIDRYLLKPETIFNYLDAIGQINHWSIEGPDQTQMIANYLTFWKKLPAYYEALYQGLLGKGIGYQGMAYRQAVAVLENWADMDSRHYFFAGFNALNAAEETIFQRLIALGKASVFWDSDAHLMQDEAHDASLFMRRYQNNWPHYRNKKLGWRFNHFSEPKNIRIIGTPKSIGQAKIAGQVVEEIMASSGFDDSKKLAVVLGDENLLLPLLHALPEASGPLNITMSYPGRNTLPFLLVSKLFRLHANAVARDKERYVFYYKDVLEILRHPLVEPYVDARPGIRAIVERNISFIPHAMLMNIMETESEFFQMLFSKWTDPLSVLQNLSEILIKIRNQIGRDSEQEKVTLAMLYSCYKLVNQLIGYYSQPGRSQNLDTLKSLYRELADLAGISFEGEPLEGLQIMGVLESRLLDFDHVVITGLNEGKFPSGKGGNSFIPFDVKLEKELPTYKEKDAIYSFHFYHLLLRAKNVYLIYNTESEGLDAGEKSRFLTQLEIEKRPMHQITHEVRFADVPVSPDEIMEIPKTDRVMDRLKEIAASGFSPSALASYIRNPVEFYFRKVLRISETDDVEESIALNTLGTIIHGTLEELYKPRIGRPLMLSDIEECNQLVDAEIARQFEKIYRDGDVKTGRNLLAYEVARRHVRNFLKQETEALNDGDEIIIVDLERKCERMLEHEDLPFPVKIGGNVDRIEIRNGRLRIVDYKTGKVEAAHMKISGWEDITVDLKREKALQVLAYAFMYQPLAEGREMEVGIISFKNLRSGFLPFTFVENKVADTIVSEEILKEYANALVHLLKEILDPEAPFVEKV